MRIYGEHAGWYHLLTAPEDYVEEAEWVRQALLARGAGRRLLELGSGGGNLASHLTDFDRTLTDLSPQILALSETINPGVHHVAGDMRTLRVDGEPFDAVLIHDAIGYMLAAADLEQALATAFFHLRPGGIVVVQPDHIVETFAPATEHGGHDGPDGRGLRYLEWIHPPDPDGTVPVDFVCLLRHPDGSVTSVHDRHRFGLFDRATWRSAFAVVASSSSRSPATTGAARSSSPGARPDR